MRATAPLFRTLNGVVRPLAKRGLGSPAPVGIGVVTVENTGRVSGRTYEIPLLGARFGNTVVTATVRARSQWIRNLEASPDTALWLCGRRRPARAEVRRGPVSLASFSII